MKLYSTVKCNNLTGEIKVLSIDSEINDKPLCDDIIQTVKDLVPDPEAFVGEARVTGEVRAPEYGLTMSAEDEDACVAILYAYETHRGITKVTRSMKWVIAPCENVSLSKTDMSSIASDYDYEVRKAMVRDRLRNMMTDAGATDDLNAMEAREAEMSVSWYTIRDLIDDLVHDISKSIDDYGCDEDWSIDDAFKEHDDAIKCTLRLFEGDEFVQLTMTDRTMVSGTVTDMVCDTIVIEKEDGTTAEVDRTKVIYANTII